MKLFSTICLLAALNLAAAPVVKLGKYRGYGENRLSFNKSIIIAGDRNYYDLNLLQNKPNANGQQKTFINLSEPSQYWNFGRATIDFLSMSVNGIDMSRIIPSSDSIKPWSDGDAAGARFSLNFDGAEIIVNAHMKTGSPLLFLTFSQPEKQITPVKKYYTITFNMIISRFVTDKKGTTVWKGVYARQAKTAARDIAQQGPGIEIKPEDRYIIFSDEILDGSDKEKGAGPCLIAFDMKNGVTGSLVLRNSYSSHLAFKIPGNVKEFKCAILQHKGAVSNREFMERFASEKDAYTKLD